MTIMKKKNNTHSQKKSQQNKDDNKKKEIPWPDLPQRLIKHIAKHPNTVERINFGLATKSWRPSPTSRHSISNPDQITQPWLVVSNDVEMSKEMPQFCGIQFPREYWWYWYQRNRPLPRNYPWNHFSGCSHGVLFARPAVAASDSPNSLYLFHPKDLFTDYVPAWDNDTTPFRCAALSSVYVSYPDKSCVLMVATGISAPAFMFCRLGAERREWIKKDCAVAEPNSYFSHDRRRKRNGEDFMSFTNAIGFEGKFYALSSQGTLALIEQVGDHDCFQIATLGKTRAIPSVPFRGFRECLIESDGEILLVFLVHRKSMNAVDVVEVYQLRFDDLSWVKIESLGDERTLFVGNDCCTSVCAKKVGCRGNCVYFKQRGVDGWSEFDMRFRSISQAWADRINIALEWDEPISSEDDR